MNSETAAQTQSTPDQLCHGEGTALLEQGNHQDAIEAFKKALMHNIERHDTQFALGVCYTKTGDFAKAVDHLQNAGVLAPHHTETWSNLAVARLQLGRYSEALSAIRQARRYAEDPHNPELIKTLAMCIAPIEDFDINPHFVEEVTMCFQTPGVESRKLVYTAQKLFLHQAVIKKLLEHSSASGFRDFGTLLKDQTMQWPVLNHPLFVRMMSDHILWRDEIEIILHGLRRELLEKAQQSPLTDEALWPNALHFLCALAQQCFIGEYVYDISDKEIGQVATLEARIQQNPTAYDVALLGCYKPLCNTEFANDLASNQAFSNDPALAAVLRMQILEPAEEDKIREHLAQLTTIEDMVSLKVKSQYEAFPYPRWVSTAVQATVTFRHMLQYKYKQLDDSQLPADDFVPEVLIAGCGTGRQSVEWSLLVPQSKNTAIDITASSLAYAQRKTNEMGLENIDYGQADILKLKELGRNFDVIQCGGVLHHMGDPMEGWRILTDILKPGGFMMIGLYSEIARRPVVAAREYISQQGIDNTAEGIRELRKHIRGLPQDHMMRGVMDNQDFYSLSECRDLLFHVQEQRYTASDLEKCIDELGLEFLGFQGPPTPSVIQHYKSKFPDDPHAVNLRNWHKYELDNPHIFKGMYQFWLRKPE